MQRPDPEVPERARRRTFTAQYKLEILAAYEAAPEGEKGALLRREGLYSSHIVEWRVRGGSAGKTARALGNDLESAEPGNRSGK
jgi:transposase